MGHPMVMYISSSFPACMRSTAEAAWAPGRLSTAHGLQSLAVAPRISGSSVPGSPSLEMWADAQGIQCIQRYTRYGCGMLRHAVACCGILWHVVAVAQIKYSIDGSSHSSILQIRGSLALGAWVPDANAISSSCKWSIPSVLPSGAWKSKATSCFLKNIHGIAVNKCKQMQKHAKTTPYAQDFSDI